MLLKVRFIDIDKSSDEYLETFVKIVLDIGVVMSKQLWHLKSKISPLKVGFKIWLPFGKQFHLNIKRLQHEAAVIVSVDQPPTWEAPLLLHVLS